MYFFHLLINKIFHNYEFIVLIWYYSYSIHISHILYSLFFIIDIVLLYLLLEINTFITNCYFVLSSILFILYQCVCFGFCAAVQTGFFFFCHLYVWFFILSHIIVMYVGCLICVFIVVVYLHVIIFFLQLGLFKNFIWKIAKIQTFVICMKIIWTFLISSQRLPKIFLRVSKISLL